MDYEYDVFLSYRRGPPVGEWVNNHFYPQLLNWLPLELNRETKVYKDDQATLLGTHWPQALKRALHLSRCLLCVWSPDYFWHEWCVAEWRSMVAREKLLGYGTNNNPAGLIVPVVFHDGKNFPPEAQQVQYKDFREYNIPVASFCQTAR